MKIQKTRSVKTPTRGTDLAAGIDFYVPDEFETVEIKPGCQLLIPSGIKVQCPNGFALIAFNKSGIATRQQLIAGACVVDEDYEGEIHIHVINASNKNQIVAHGQKLIQFILLPINYENVELVDELPKRQSQRGTGGFGSTGLQ